MSLVRMRTAKFVCHKYVFQMKCFLKYIPFSKEVMFHSTVDSLGPRRCMFVKCSNLARLSQKKRHRSLLRQPRDRRSQSQKINPRQLVQ